MKPTAILARIPRCLSLNIDEETYGALNELNKKDYNLLVGVAAKCGFQ